MNEHVVSATNSKESHSGGAISAVNPQATIMAVVAGNIGPTKTPPTLNAMPMKWVKQCMLLGALIAH